VTAPRKLAAKFGTQYRPDDWPQRHLFHWRPNAKPRREVRLNRHRARRMDNWPPELAPGLRHLGAVIADMAAAMRIALEPWQRRMLAMTLAAPRHRRAQDTMGQQPPV